jgi:hypothetical protein
MWVQDCVALDDGSFVKVLAEAGVIDSLVATLKHESPYCVAAAAATIGYASSKGAVGKALIEASGAIPALVDIINRPITPGDFEKAAGMFCR